MRECGSSSGSCADIPIITQTGQVNRERDTAAVGPFHNAALARPVPTWCYFWIIACFMFRRQPHADVAIIAGEQCGFSPAFPAKVKWQIFQLVRGATRRNFGLSFYKTRE